MTAFALNGDAVDHLLPGLREIAAEWPKRFTAHGTKIHFLPKPERKGLAIRRVAGELEVEYATPREAYRALGILLGDPEAAPLEESTPFSSLGVMLDVSRNAVLKTEAFEFYIRRFALMGINSVQLYMEDMYALEGEPFFGYARGAYSAEELRSMDAYAAKFGIELIPCIQTLGHLEQILQWPAYEDMLDVPGVLLIGEKKVYALILEMLRTLSGCFRSRRIHIGMDEAHGVGLGRYRRLNGECRPFDILNEHLGVVTGLCESLGLRPMMWSDMYFRIGSRINDYYDPEAKIPDDVPGRIPRGVDLVYWDYYHSDPAFYAEWIDRHRAMGKDPIFATGGWNWGRLWTRFPAGFPRISAGMKAAREKSLGEAFITLWGDDGAECDPFSVLPSIQHFAECAYGQASDERHLATRFLGSCGESLSPLLLGSLLDADPNPAPSPDSSKWAEWHDSANFSKWILWHDPILSFLSPCIPDGMAAHYRRLSEQLEEVGERTRHVTFAATVARLLAGKTRLHVEIRPAYQTRDRKALADLHLNVLPSVIRDLESLGEIHREIWDSWYKPFGWEVIDRRYGGMLARLRSLGRLLDQALKNPEAQLPEFEYELQKTEPGIFFNFARTAFPTTWR